MVVVVVMSVPFVEDKKFLKLLFVFRFISRFLFRKRFLPASAVREIQQHSRVMC